MAGTHQCAVPKNFREQFSIAAAFLARGADKNQLCLFVAEDNGLDVVRMALKSHGLDVEGLEKTRRLAVLSSRATPLGHRPLDAALLYRAWAEKTAEAICLGFTGLRVAVEMTWALDCDPAALAAYEAGAGPLFQDNPIDALCLYNRNVFHEKVIASAALGGHSQFLESIA